MRCRQAIALSALLCLLSTPAWTMPGMKAGAQADEKSMMEAAVKSFEKADHNKNCSLSKDEFMKAYPSMKEEAFAAIDGNHDGAISCQEWQDFCVSHSMGGQGIPPASRPGQSGKLPMVTPPSMSTCPSAVDIPPADGK